MMSNSRPIIDSIRRPRPRFGVRWLGLPVSLVLCLACSGAHDAPLNPDDPAYLRRQYVWFQTQTPQRQLQLRRLHEGFLALEEKEQTQLTRVMQAYNAWLSRLPDADRQRVQNASTVAERLEVVRQLRERDWVQTLPRPYREEYASLEEAARPARVQEWRTEEAERREEWALALKHWSDMQPGKVPPMLLNEGRTQLETFLGRLRENLSENERRELDDARAAADEHGNYFWFVREVVRLADLHPVLPGKTGPRDFESLPQEVQTYLTKADPAIRRKGGEMSRELRRAQGRWPDFAVELTRYCQRTGLKLPVPLGDCRKEEMPAEVREFLSRVLEPQLKRSADGKAELKALEDAQGQWPEYPRLILDLSRKYKLPVPGWTLPGPPQAWDRFRAARFRSK